MRKYVFPIICCFFVFFSLLPTGYEIWHRDRIQSNRTFELVHNFPTDYNFYLSRIRQGIEGRTSVIEEYTSEPHEGSFIHVFYLVLGLIGRWVRVPWDRAGDVYHMARVVFGGFLLVVIAEYCKKAFLKLRKGAAEVANENFDPFSVSPHKIPSESAGQARLPQKALAFSGQSETGQNFVRSPHRLFLLLKRFFFSLLTSHFSLLTFLLAVTASTWPKLVAVAGNMVVPATISNIAGWRLGGYMPWWSVMDSLQRITFIPHLLLGQALIIFLILALGDEATMRKPGNWIFLGILAFILGLVFPPGLLFVIATTGLLSILEFLMDGKKLASQGLRSWIWKYVVPRVVVLGLGIPSLVYLSLMTSFYPWKRLAEFDVIRPLPFDYWEYFKAVGPILPIGLIGLFIAVRKKEKAMLPSVAWVVAWLGLLGVFRFIPAQSPLRFSEMIPHVPLAVLTAYLFFDLRQRALVGVPWFSPRQGPDHSFVHHRPFAKAMTGLETARLPARLFLYVMYHVSFVIPTGLILLGGGVMYSSWLWQRDFVDHKMRSSYPLVPTGSYVMYPLKDFVLAMKFLQDATSRDTVILSETTAGNYMPVYSGNRVYVGHANTVKAEEKEAAVRFFFRGSMTAGSAKDWLRKERLSWIFFGPQEMEEAGTGDLANIYPFLVPSYKNSYVTVYHLP